MTHTTPLPDHLLNALLAARRQHQALVATPEHAATLPDAETAFAVQQAAGVALGGWAPAELPRHWKSGGSARAQPLIHAPLLPQGVRHSLSGQPARLDDLRFFTPGIEAEIALRLARDVSPARAAALTDDAAALDGLIDAMAVSIEVVDSRFANLAQVPALLKLADFQVHGALVLGDWTPWRPVDWSNQRCRLQVETRAATEFVGSHPLGTPQWLLPTWLRHLTRHGATVPAGTIVTTGSWNGLAPVQPGDTVRAAFDGIGEAALRL